MKLKNLFRKSAASPAPEPANVPNQEERPEELKINNVEILYERRKGLRSALSLFYYYKEHVDELNRIEMPKNNVANVLKVCDRTVKNWVKVLSRAGIIKYKYSGSVRLNPEICFSGTKENFEKALLEFKRFKSDI